MAFEFEINNLKWKIVKIPNEELQNLRRKIGEEQNIKYNEDSWYYGFCDCAHHTIYISDYICYEEQQRTLIHELTHAWLWSHGASYTQYCEDAVCDIVASIYCFVSQVFTKYYMEMSPKSVREPLLQGDQIIEYLKAKVENDK